MGFKCLVRDQEVDGSNPFAPTTFFDLALRSPGLTSAHFYVVFSCKFSVLSQRRWNEIGRRATVASFSYVPYLLAVGHPDVFHLHGVVEEPAAFALPRVKPVDDAAFVGEYLLQIAYREGFHVRGAGFIREAPDRVDVVVLGERLHQFRGAAGDDVYDAIRQIAGFENLIKIAGNQRIFLRRNGDDRVAG